MTEKELGAIAATAANRYARRCWWVDEEDLRQEAWVGMLKARPNWKPGDEWETASAAHRMSWEAAFYWKAAFFTVRAFVLRTSAPVSGASRQPKGLHREELDLNMESLEKLADEAVHTKRVTETARTELRQVFTTLAGGQLAASILIEEYTPGEVAVLREVPILNVYSATCKARRAIRRHDTLRQLWLEL